MKARIVENLCIACGLCREVCPEHAVHPKMQDIHHRYEVLAHECTGCGDCLPFCPVPGALEEYTARTVSEEGTALGSKDGESQLS